MEFNRNIAGLIDDLKKIDEVVDRINAVEVIKGEVHAGFSAYEYSEYIPMIRDISYKYKGMIQTILENANV